jgi:hypothetical protein
LGYTERNNSVAQSRINAHGIHRDRAVRLPYRHSDDWHSSLPLKLDSGFGVCRELVTVGLCEFESERTPLVDAFPPVVGRRHDVFQEVEALKINSRENVFDDP